ncbi:DUF397 domain-containing protein [Actinoalloteichus hymeniacidonis]|uniref:DUF397 family protein n=1 Tax=Actinoalloteichus hymeniacidonis TaxID=340345 RepID=A0AAC9HU65_9PSEU|nr:DUF397 domain-containing protein [Actinoalloteichus hymeniacidonis]AOS65513.1 putative DUF397 family protein [Actinoalloteichus hymeniacidonis]MBB5906400.1 hypothetical protein [Actinoalloteichus hymeniacidonis]
MTAHPMTWRKAARSGSTSNCVEIGRGSELVGIRDTKNRAGGTLMVNPASFGAFLNAVKTDRMS